MIHSSGSRRDSVTIPTQPFQYSLPYSITWNGRPLLVSPVIWSSGDRLNPIPNGGFDNRATDSKVGLPTKLQPRSRNAFTYRWRRTNSVTPTAVPDTSSTIMIRLKTWLPLTESTQSHRRVGAAASC